MSSVEETDFSPKCENCDQVVEYVNDEGLCQTCEEEHAIAIYEARNDRD
jgi:Zn finger protein HypA/HybF involved in hydrogenase expression|tara:strand:- start:386 stop:532 length:147 start_codon:yes stop_codon:yes gene_type:complete